MKNIFCIKSLFLFFLILIFTFFFLGESFVYASNPSVENFNASPQYFNSNTNNVVFNYSLVNVINGQVTLEIYNTENILVRSIDGGIQSSGEHSIIWDGKNNEGQKVDEGDYIAKLNVSFGDGGQYQYVLNWGYSQNRFKKPTNIAISSSGNIYVFDSGNYRIKKFDSNGNFLTEWGSYGSGDGQFRYLNGIAVDSLENVYLADTENNRIQKFDANGNFLLKWGSYGNGDQQFVSPRGITIDANNNVYVISLFTSGSNQRIQKFDANGNFLSKFLISGPTSSVFPRDMAIDSKGYIYVSFGSVDYNFIRRYTSNGDFSAHFGGTGSADGQFKNPLGLAVNNVGNVYVADSENHRIQKFDSIGNFLKKWGNWGNENGQFNIPSDVSLDSSGNIYVVDTNNNRIQKFDSSGNFISFIGVSPSDDDQLNSPSDLVADLSEGIYVFDSLNNRVKKFDANGNFLLKWGSYGSGDGQFKFSLNSDGQTGIAKDSSGNIYVADTYNNRIQKFDANGNFIRSFYQNFSYPVAVTVDSSGNIYVSDNTLYIKKLDPSGNLIKMWGGRGSGNGQFNYPVDLAVDNFDNLYVVDRYNHRIQKFDKNGDFFGGWGGYGSGDRQFKEPVSIAIDSENYIYVVDQQNNRIQKFDSKSNFVAKWGSYGTGNGQFDRPRGVTVDKMGNVYVTDRTNRLQRFSPSVSSISVQANVKIDNTPPQTNIIFSGDLGDNDWYISDVELELSSSDNFGVVKTEYSFDSFNWNDYSSPFSISEEGVRTVYYRSYDLAGNIEEVKNQEIKIDKIGPIINIISPNQTTYLHSEIINIDFKSVDGISGVYQTTVHLDGNQYEKNLIDLVFLSLGKHEIKVKSKNSAGLETEELVEFEIIASIDSLISLVKRFYGDGQINNKGIYNSLMEKLENAKKKIDSDDLKTAQNMLEAFINEIESQSGKHILSSVANLLREDAEYVINELND